MIEVAGEGGRKGEGREVEVRGEEVKITITSCECHAFDYVKLCSCLKANFDRFISSKIGYTKKVVMRLTKVIFAKDF